MAQLDLTRRSPAAPLGEGAAGLQIHRYSLYLLYALTIGATIALIVVGASYYRLPLAERPDHPLQETLRPSGFIGHGVGVVGSAMMLLLLLYSWRKRARFMQDKGNIRYWLNYHIWLGVTGPVLVLFHTTFKFGGIVSISFWSMTAVALSGVLGRYIYLQIPRSLSGHELSARDLEEMDRDLMRQLEEIHGVGEDVLNSIQQLSAVQEMVANTGLSNLWVWITQDLRSRSRIRHIHSLLHRTGMSRVDVHQVITLARQRAKLRRRMDFLAQAQKLLHHWHIFHKPFAFVMLAIMVVHVVVAIVFGQRWIWS